MSRSTAPVTARNAVRGSAAVSARAISAGPAGARPTHRLARRLAVATADREAGMTTAEYAVGTVAACGFGGILYKVITSPEVLGLITDVISRAFNLSF